MESYLRVTIDTYNQIAGEYVDTTSAIRPQYEFEVFTGLVAAAGIVLDIGCAWGRDCIALAHLGFQPIGVDLSIGMLVQVSKQAPSTPLINADLRRLPLPDSCADGVWCCATLLHLRRVDIVPALSEFRRVLRPGGVGYLQVKSGDGEEMTSSSFSKDKPRFFTYFQCDEFRDYCLGAGFSIIDEHVYNEKDRNGSSARDQEQLCFLVRKTE